MPWKCPKEPTWIVGDHERLHQIIVNLLANATKYTEPCGNIAVIVAQDEQDVTLRVRDDGIGLTPEMIPRIFDLFAQVHARNEVAARAGNRTRCRAASGDDAWGRGVGCQRRAWQRH